LFDIAVFSVVEPSGGSGGVFGGAADVLTCGGCGKGFSLSDIVRFIGHKVRTCPALSSGGSGGGQEAATAAAAAAALLNNNNLVGSGGGGDESEDDVDDDEDEEREESGGVKRVKPSISAPLAQQRRVLKADASTNTTTSSNQQGKLYMECILFQKMRHICKMCHEP
jgi:hypothetical protein